MGVLADSHTGQKVNPSMLPCCTGWYSLSLRTRMPARNMQPQVCSCIIFTGRCMSCTELLDSIPTWICQHGCKIEEDDHERQPTGEWHVQPPHFSPLRQDVCYPKPDQCCDEYTNAHQTAAPASSCMYPDSAQTQMMYLAA